MAKAKIASIGDTTPSEETIKDAAATVADTAGVFDNVSMESVITDVEAVEAVESKSDKMNEILSKLTGLMEKEEREALQAEYLSLAGKQKGQPDLDKVQTKMNTKKTVKFEA